MKKLMILACCAATVLGAAAQEAVLKNADHAMKVDGVKRHDVRAMLKGAMQDPATKNNPKTWYLAGKNEFANWAEQFQNLTLGRDADRKDMGQSMIDGFNYFMTALPLDTIREVNSKGEVKIKTNYSKKIVKEIIANSENFYNAGAFLWEANDAAGAYQAWSIYTSLPTLPQLDKDAPAAPADSVQAQNYYNMGIFAYTAKMYPEATEAFVKATEYDYPGNDAFDNAIACANMAGDKDRVFEIAHIAFQKRGDQNPAYIGELINGYIDRKQYTEALAMLDRAIEATPANAQLYNAKGILLESQISEDTPADQAAAANDEAFGYYKKAAELDPSNGLFQYHYGRVIANKAYRINDASSELDNAAYNKVREEQVLPLFKEAVEYLEKGIAIDPDHTRDALPILRNIYYNLGDAANLERIESM